MNFDEWVENNYFKGHEPSEDRLKDIKYGWNSCKKEFLKKIDEMSCHYQMTNNNQFLNKKELKNIIKDL